MLPFKLARPFPRVCSSRASENEEPDPVASPVVEVAHVHATKDGKSQGTDSYAEDNPATEETRNNAHHAPYQTTSGFTPVYFGSRAVSTRGGR